LPKIIQRKKVIEETAQEVKECIEQSQEERIKLVDIQNILSTGSTLLDLAISGKRRRGGGVPGGIMIEISGPESSGKTAILAEISSNSQSKGGDVLFLDPEARLDKEYAEIYGLVLSDSADNYKRPNTVKEMFNEIWKWKPVNEDKNIINVVSADSLAALSTEMEMEDEDKMGMKRAKDFSAELRKSCRMLASKSWLLACSNQLRESTTGGTDSPGGRAVKFYASVRITIKQDFKNGKIIRQKKIAGIDVKKVQGINSTCRIIKSSVDNPFREASIPIIFGYGIDDIRANLEYFKDMTGAGKYYGDKFSTIDKAIDHIEENELENELKEKVIDLWEDIEEQFTIRRKTKQR